MLSRRLDEKHDLMRRVWEFERKFESYNDVLRRSQMIVWQNTQKTREHGRQNRLLHRKVRRGSGSYTVAHMRDSVGEVLIDASGTADDE